MANFLPKECNMDQIYDNTKDRCSTTYGHMLMQMKLKYPETFIFQEKEGSSASPSDLDVDWLLNFLHP